VDWSDDLLQQGLLITTCHKQPCYQICKLLSSSSTPLENVGETLGNTTVNSKLLAFMDFIKHID